MGISSVQGVAVLGFLLSSYGYYIERKSEADKRYKAVCDINDRMSCSKTFQSKYGTFLGVSNSLWGMLFYFVVILLAGYGLNRFVFYLSLLAVLGSVYLAYILYVKLKNFCLICNGIYLVNVLLLVFSYLGL
ncbi:hypothetical protein CMO92_00295 [Candidatus Woesearchaeota archaeon]|nr:hypothetical protein [Candidatus Woesearchaeota archaeon]|tara:strand:+ start:439 stop:834 length:396 start_codon:yes stop_codon:yes gene_type:complete